MIGTRPCATAVALILSLGCSKPRSLPADGGGAGVRESGQPPSGGSDARSPPASEGSKPANTIRAATAGESRRAILPGLEGVTALPADLGGQLAPHWPLVRSHFSAKDKGPYLLEAAALGIERTAALVADRDATHPILLVTRGDALEWAKDRPTAGITPPARPIALTSHYLGGPMLLVFVQAVSMVAARIWDDRGNPFADLEVLTIDACEDLSVAYDPGQGWLVVAVRPGGARAQWITEDGTMPWPREGLEVGAPWRRSAPSSIVFDTETTAILLQHATVGESTADHVLAFRYDLEGHPLWASPVDLGAEPRVPKGEERLGAKLAREGVVRVELPRGVLLGPARAVEIDGEGHLRWIVP